MFFWLVSHKILDGNWYTQKYLQKLIQLLEVLTLRHTGYIQDVIFGVENIKDKLLRSYWELLEIPNKLLANLKRKEFFVHLFF